MPYINHNEGQTDKIPKIFHHTWKDKDMPLHFTVMIDSWKENHSGWTFMLWTDDMNRQFIMENYPQFIKKYDNYPYNIQRVDAVRYFILSKLGGVFLDLDFECLENIEPLLANKTCVLAKEPDDHCKRFGKDFIVCNAFMACVPNNEFFINICETLNNNGKYTNPANSIWNEVLNSTGPLILTDIYNNYKDKNKVSLLPADLVYPLDLKECRKLFQPEYIITKKMQKKIDAAYAIHYFFGTWWV